MPETATSNRPVRQVTDRRRGTHVRKLSYLHSRDVTFAVFCYGRQEFWEDSREAGRSVGAPKAASSSWTAARSPSGRGSRPDATTASARRLLTIRMHTVTERSR